MSALGWVMLSLALWHFTVFVPDRFWGGIVGSAFTAVLGAVAIGWVISGFRFPGPDDTDLVVIAYAIPGTIVGLVGGYLVGAPAAKRVEAEAQAAAEGR